MNAKQLRDNIVRPVLIELGMHSLAAEQLIMGTAAVESKLEYIRQFRDGPARGLWQMEPATHDDMAERWPRFKMFTNALMTVSGASSIDARHLEYNLRYACALARLHYWRKPGALPAPGDVHALAWYWKRHYNTIHGAGTVDHFKEAYEDIVAPIYREET